MICANTFVVLFSVTSGGNTATLSGSFTLLPSITGLSVDSGSLGIFVTVNGYGLNGVTNLTFGGVSVPIAFSSDTSVTLSLPTNGLTGSPSVYALNGAYTNSVLLYNPPIVTGFNPDRAKVGDWITLSGTNLYNITNVTIGTITEPPGGTQSTTNGATLLLRIPVTAPSSGTISVTAAGNTFTTDSNFLLLPSLTAASISLGSKGDSVTFYGYGLSDVTNVIFGGGGGTAPSATTRSNLLVTIPSGALTGTIRVESPNGNYESSQIFEVGPEITGFAPGEGAAGTNVVVSGFNLTNTTTISFNGIATTNFIVQNDSTVTVVVPTGAASGPISITTPIGTNTTTDWFYIGPALTSFTPFRGPTGSIVTITGHNLSGASAVSFNGTTSTNFTINNDSTLIVTVPEGATTGPVRVTTPWGSAQSQIQFIVTAKADLGLQMMTDTNTPVAGSDITVNFKISNQGPAAAAGVVGHFASTSAATVTSASIAQGTFTTDSTHADFVVGNLPSGSTVAGTVTLHIATNAPIDLTMTTSASSSTSDPNLGDNTVTLHLSGPVVLQISSTTNSVIRVSWPLVSAGYALEQSHALSPATWSSITNTPGSYSNQFVLEIPATDTPTFYRLRKP